MILSVKIFYLLSSSKNNNQSDFRAIQYFIIQGTSIFLCQNKLNYYICISKPSQISLKTVFLSLSLFFSPLLTINQTNLIVIYDKFIGQFLFLYFPLCHLTYSRYLCIYLLHLSSYVCIIRMLIVQETNSQNMVSSFRCRQCSII